MVDTVEALGAFSPELDRRLPKEVLEALCYHMEGMEEPCSGLEVYLEAQELDLQYQLEYLLFLRRAFPEGLRPVLERKPPKCQVWVFLDFIKVDWCQEKASVDVEFCLVWPLAPTSIPNLLEEEAQEVRDQEAVCTVVKCSRECSTDTH